MMDREKFEELICEMRQEDNMAGEGGRSWSDRADALHDQLLAAFDSLRAELDRVKTLMPETRDGVIILPLMRAWRDLVDTHCILITGISFSEEGWKIFGEDTDGHRVFTNPDVVYRFHPETGLTPEGDPRPKESA